MSEGNDGPVTRSQIPPIWVQIITFILFTQIVAASCAIRSDVAAIKNIMKQSVSERVTPSAKASDDPAQDAASPRDTAPGTTKETPK